MAPLRYVFGLGSPLPLGEGERRSNVAWKTRAAVSLIMGLLSALSMYAQESPEIAPRAIPVNVGPNDVARFLAGMPLPENSPLASLTRPLTVTPFSRAASMPPTSDMPTATTSASPKLGLSL